MLTCTSVGVNALRTTELLEKRKEKAQTRSILDKRHETEINRHVSGQQNTDNERLFLEIN